MPEQDGSAFSRRVWVGAKAFTFDSDDSYLADMEESFEPETVRLFEALVERKDVALDVGANIGLTALLLGQLAGAVTAFEPSPSTFHYLEVNVRRAGLTNIELRNIGLGDVDATTEISFSDQNRAGGFVSDLTKPGIGHVTEKIDVRRLDGLDLGGAKANFLKLDVEGYEQHVLTGGAQTIHQWRPVVTLELNHWCLNAFRRITVPEFFDFLRGYFPICLAVDSDHYLDLHNGDDSYAVMYHHIVEWQYKTLVCAFDHTSLQRFYDTYRYVGSAPRS